MSRKIVAVWLSLVMVFCFVVIIVEIAPIVRSSKTIYVDDGGEGDYTSIQAGIDASFDGDTVRVYDGTYYETVIVDKEINLIGNGSMKTIIDGGWPDHENVVTIMASGVNMSGFGLKNSYMGHEFGGIGVISSNNRISENYCWDNLYGAILWGSQNRICNNSFSNNKRDGIFVKSWGNIIENNTCSNSLERDGIWLYICADNIVSNNTCSNNSKDGISLYQSHGNHLFNNTCNSSIIYDGILIYESSNNLLWNNDLSSNNRNGIGVSHFSYNNTLTNNVITGNQIGVNLRDNCSINTVHYNDISNNGDGVILDSSSNNNTIRGNTVSDNGYGIYLESSSNNSIYHNNMITNTNQAYDDSNNGNKWDDGYPSGGNFWSDYDGIDLNGTALQNAPPPDGIGDTPYYIDFDSQDDYPLMNPVGNRLFLHKGWNLISVPYIQSDTDLETVLKSIAGSYECVERYTHSNGFGHWYINHTSKQPGVNDNNNIDHRVGFWILIKEPDGVLMQYFGTPPFQNQTITLYQGWNLVGYPSLTRYNRTDALNNLTFEKDVDSIWTYKADTQEWHEIGPSDYFEPGRGYWIYSKVKKVWEVPL